MSLIDTMFSAKPSADNPCLIEQPRFRIALPAGWKVLSPRDWRGKIVAKGPGTQTIEGQFNETHKSRRRPMPQELMLKLVEHYRSEETTKGAKVHDEALPNEMAYLEAVIEKESGLEARFVFFGPSCILDVRARELRAPMDLEYIRRILKAIEWR
jgi:hypothetical protein